MTRFWKTNLIQNINIYKFSVGRESGRGKEKGVEVHTERGREREVHRLHFG